MKVIFIGCGYLGMNLSAQLREAATVQTIGLPGPYAPYCADFLAVDAFDERDLDRVDFRDAVVVDTISLLPNNAKSDDEDAMLQRIGQRYSFLLQQLKQRKAAQLVFLSSGGTVYGNAQQPICEEAPLHPVSLYARSKVLCEQLIQNSGLPWLILRLANPYGGYQLTNKRQGVIPTAIEKILAHEEFEMWASPYSSRDYLYIDDFAQALRLLLRRRIVNQIVNIGSQQATSLDQILGIIQRQTGLALAIRHVQSEVPLVDQIVLDIGKLRRLTGFEVRVSLEEGIAREISRIRAQRKGREE